MTGSNPVPNYAQALSGAAVRGSDDEHVGRVRDIYLADATGELAAITVTVGRMRGRTVLLPAAAISPACLAGAARTPVQQITLSIGAATARAGQPPPPTAHADPQILHSAAQAVGIEEAPPA